MQYIRLPPEQQHYQQPQAGHMQYQYEQHPVPVPKPVYVDEYGRRLELIPIDSAPAPVQYAPHPFEQQQQQYGARQVAYSAAPPPGVQYQPVYQYEQLPQQQQIMGGQPQARYVYDDGGRGSVPRG